MTSKHYTTKRQAYSDLGVHPSTLDRWILKPWFPKRTRRGWNKAAVLDAVDKYRAEKEAGAGERAEKTRLECEKLRVVIAREREALRLAEMETAVREGRMLLAKDVEEEWSRAANDFRAALEAWRSHQTAKHPRMAGDIDDAANDLLARLRAANEA